jgi:hypothetical protein
VHSVDRERIGQRLSEQRPPARGPLQVCIQVNVSGESSKSGVPPEDAMALVESLLPLAGLRLRGLMAIPEALTEFNAQRTAFGRARRLFESIKAELSEVPLWRRHSADGTPSQWACRPTLRRRSRKGLRSFGSAARFFGRAPRAQGCQSKRDAPLISGARLDAVLLSSGDSGRSHAP